MSQPDKTALVELDISETVTILVSWKSSNKRLTFGKLRTSPEVANEFRTIAKQWIQSIRDREVEAWSPDADAPMEVVLSLPLEHLQPVPELTRTHEDTTFLEVLNGSSEVESIKPDDLPKSTIAFYAIIIGNDPGRRIAFLRRANPQRSLRQGKLFTTLRQTTLERVEDPIFGFDRTVDIVIDANSAWVLSQAAFVSIFRENETLAAQVPNWVADVGAHIPISEDGAVRLQQKALRDSRARTRLETIARRGHLETVTTEQLRNKMAEFGLDPERCVDATGKLSFEEDDIPIVLQFLNEDLFVGALSNSPFRADKKQSRG